MKRSLPPSTALVFAGIVLVVALWIGSGMIGRSPPGPEGPAVAPGLATVAASWSEAREVTRELVLYGDVEPSHVTPVRARTQGLVEMLAEQGAVVAEGEILARLSTDDRQARLAGARAQVASAERDFEASRQLAERGIGPEAEAEARRAQMEAARAELRAVEFDLANTEVAAPVAGVVNRRLTDQGAFLSAGTEILELVENDPLVAVVHVQQSAIARVRPGQPAQVTFIGGATRDGRVRFVSPFAEAETRTFRVEIEVPNPGRELPAGLSAEVVIPTERLAAHRVSPALMRLDEQGRMGLQTIDEGDRIGFVPVEIVSSDAGGIWVTGPEPRARLVTISHGTLSPGQQVTVEETPEEYAMIGGTEAAGDAVEGGLAGGDMRPDEGR